MKLQPYYMLKRTLVASQNGAASTTASCFILCLAEFTISRHKNLLIFI